MINRAGGRHATSGPTRRARVTVTVLGAVLAVAAGAGGYLVVASPGRAAPVAGAAAHPGHAAPTGHPIASSAPVKTASSAPAPQRHPNPLGTAAASYLTTRQGTVSVAVYDIHTRQSWSLGQGSPQAEASIVKVDILATLLAERGNSGTSLPDGDRSLAAQMIEDSDNDAATSLWNAVGGAARIRAFNTEAGLARTTPSSCVDCPGFPWPGWGLTTTVPTDQLALLRALVGPRPPLTSADGEYALSLMESVTPSQRWGVSAGIPSGVTVALKNGWLPLNNAGTDWQINSIGWISGRGRDYLMAALSTANPDEQYGIDTISRLGTMVWSDMR
ncbi:MAG: serine hydrolase [Streptosporangiaceae bacterium]